MGGKWQCSLWVGAAFTLLFACGDSSGPMGSGSSENTDTKSDDGASGDKATAAMGGKSNPASKDDSSTGNATKAQGQKTPPKDEPLGDQTDFFSADTQASNGGNHGLAERAAAGGVATSASAPMASNTATTPAVGQAPGAPGAAAKDASASQASVERGDIFRVLPDQRILNLNQYRGVQVIDVRDPSNPKIEGRLAINGTPVEMYVVGDRAFVLLNGWVGYFGTNQDLKVRQGQGGLVMSVDIKDRANPKLIDQAEIKGDVLTSRLTQGTDGKSALYVAASIYDTQAHSVIKSFQVDTGKLEAKSELDLGGSVQDVQASTSYMMVAATDYTKMRQQSTVTVIDISSTDGSMKKGGTVTAQGFVQNKFNMDAYKDVLRVVSGSNWSGSQENHVETWSLKNLQTLDKLDDCKLSARDLQRTGNEQLYATVFIENRGFFVTYYRQDPFHAFSIDDSGQCAEHTAFVVSGWNDFLRPAINDTRLLGIGHNDVNNTRLLSVSLYDAVNLDNAKPLLARADIELNGAYSEANWDDRAFTTLEDAVSVKAPDGTPETGLLLLPFSGWDNTNQTQIAKVQIFTFSNKTVTKRGSMEHGSPVRRSFEVEADTTANLSDDVLSLFDTTDPDQPKQLGRADVAPSYSRVFVYGDYVARLRDNTQYYNNPTAGSKLPQSTVQIVKGNGDVDGNAAITSFEVPAGANLTQVGKLLVSVYSQTMYDSTGQNPKTTSQIQVWDLSDPTKPQKRGGLETDRLDGGYYGGYPGGPGIPIDGIAAKGGVACFDCIRPYYGGQTGYVVGNAIVFASIKPQQKSQGFVTQCDTYPTNRNCTNDSSGNYTCENPYYSGSISCVTPDGGKESCSGQFYQCDDKSGDCKEVDPPSFTNRNCNHYEQFRNWSSYNFDTLDLSNPDSPTIAKRVELPTDEEGTSIIAVGSTLYFNFQQPYTKKDDARSYVKHFVRFLGFGDPQKASVGDPINIPGDVIAAMDTTLYTRDFVWDNNDARTMVARLTVSDNKAHLQASDTFKDRSVSAVKLDGSGHVLVNSDPVNGGGIVTPIATRVAAPGVPVASAPGSVPEQPKSKLSILDDLDLKTVGEADIDSWATFTDAKKGRALYQVSGGLLVVDVSDPTKPKAQAFFPVVGWPGDIVFDGDSILFAAGMYGVYRLDAGVTNLLSP